MKPIEERTMTVRERSRLTACEQDIDKGGNLIVTALAVIRDEKLYRDTHETFEAYCVERWKMRADYANKLIAHGKVLANLEEANLNTNGIQIKERATREIRDLQPAEQVEVVKVAVDKVGKATAKAVKEAKEELQATGKISGGTTFNVGEIERAGDGQETPKEVPAMLDSLGRKVPEHLRSACDNANRLTAVGKTSAQLVRELNGLKGQPGAEHLVVQPLVKAVQDVGRETRDARFLTTCPRCHGAKCEFCTEGFIAHKHAGMLTTEEKVNLGVK